MCEFTVLKRLPNGLYLYERNLNGWKITQERSYYGLMFDVDYMKRHGADPIVRWVGEEREV